MDKIGNIVGCSLHAATTDAGATVSATGCRAVLANGDQRWYSPASISIRHDGIARRVRVYLIDGGLCLTPVPSGDEIVIAPIGIDDDVDTPKGVYGGGLVVLGLVDIPAKSAPAISDGDKPLDTRERRTLLVIIGALAEAASIDLSKHHKAGETIAAMLATKGVTVSARRIGDHLKLVPDALDSRRD